MSSNSKEYICPRCHYKTNRKLNMERHFQRKSVCPNKHNIVLTEEIKSVVLDDCQYHVEKTDSIIQPGSAVQNYNTFYNIVSSMEPLDKMGLLHSYKDTKTIDIENDLESQFEYRLERLRGNQFRGGYFLSLENLLGIVNNVTQRNIDSVHEINVMFNKVYKKIQLYRGRKWESYIEDEGIKELVSLIKSYYLNDYELYLIKNLYTDQPTGINRFKLQEHLTIYYNFIASFDLMPCIADMDDNDIMGYYLRDSTKTCLTDKYMKVYFDEKKDLKSTEISKLKKKIGNIIRSNTAENLSMLDKVIIETLKVDQNFRNELLKTRQFVSNTY